MRILSVIGTRPQYVKIKPIFDFCNENNIEHIIVDTNQHYSENVSDYFINEFSLVIDEDLRTSNSDELSFITQTIDGFTKTLEKYSPDFVLIYGDTNSTLSTSLVCYKKNIPFAHVEAGLRCNNIKVPEELNRIVADLTSEIQFTPKKTGHIQDYFDNEVVCGDLEYELLNKYYDRKITFDSPPVMTIHRKENLEINKFNKIINFCKTYGKEINFFLHHSTKGFMEKHNYELPKNIKIKPPAKYSEMVDALSTCKFIISDSGGLMKTSPFFGKKCLVMRDDIEWVEVERSGYGIRFSKLENPISWVLNNKMPREKEFYTPHGKPSKIIIDTLKNFIYGNKK